MPKKIFISFSSRDQQMAASICAALELRGHPCWMSSRDVAPGENYQGAIVRAICDAGAMVLVFSANANNSDEIKKELSLASQQKLVVIPVRAEDVLPNADYRYELATRQWIDLFGNWEQALDRLAKQIDIVLPRDAAAVPQAASVTAPAARRGRPSWLLPAAVLAVLAIAGAGWLLSQPRSGTPANAALTATVNAVHDVERRARLTAASAASMPTELAAAAGEHSVGIFPTADDERYAGGYIGSGKTMADAAAEDIGPEGMKRDERWTGVGVYTGSVKRAYTERVGEFVNGMMHGYGVEYRRDGSKWLGTFQDNRLQGLGARYDAAGKLVEQGIYNGGLLVRD